MQKLIFARGTKQARALSLKYRENKLQRIYHGIYTDDLATSLELIVKRNWLQIVAYIVTGGILSHRTAHDLNLTPFSQHQYIVFVTSSYVKTINLPHLIIKVLKGNKTLYVEQVLPNLARSNPARMLLENLSPLKRAYYQNVKTIGKAGVELYLAKHLKNYQELGLNNIRDAAKKVANDLGLESEFHTLNQIISSLLSTNKESNILQTSYAKAIVKKEPYDNNRILLLENLCAYLQKSDFIPRNYQYNSASFKHLSFYEAYFSNFIEGTEFLIDEAEDIVFAKQKILHRHADSHDILANYNITNDFISMSHIPKNLAEFLEILQTRHSHLMMARPEKNPGKFKTTDNKAGNTIFVTAPEVIGTLSKGFEIYQMLADGMPKALFMHFLISEVHPFADGNGRLARIMLNSELVSAGMFKIIIPTVFRDNYLNGLRQISRESFFQTYSKVMDKAQAYTASIPWLDYAEARKKLEEDHAEHIPDDGLPIFNRALRNLLVADFSVN